MITRSKIHKLQKTHHFGKSVKTHWHFHAIMKLQDTARLLAKRAANLNDIFGDARRHTNS